MFKIPKYFKAYRDGVDQLKNCKKLESEVISINSLPPLFLLGNDRKK